MITCCCGHSFTKRKTFLEHVALHNLRWPRRDASDRHGHQSEAVRVIRDSSDGNQDYFIPLYAARVLYETGKLDQDLTNHCYTSRRS